MSYYVQIIVNEVQEVGWKEGQGEGKTEDWKELTRHQECRLCIKS